ncbi:MAG: hypothetical protein JRG91_03375 [Deltaproteobacteria bacterium]|nr:hypothetical protein [Deltaproteobacteria bacterium]
MKTLKNVLACCFAIALYAGCGDDDDNGDPDGTTDVTEEQDVVEEAIEDMVEEDGCPPDDATHIYINVMGAVQSLVPGGNVEGLMVAAISPLDALLPGEPTPIDTTISGTGGVFMFECLDVGTVTLGLVLLIDDDPDGTDDDYFPTGTGVAAFVEADGSDKVDIGTAAPFAVANTLIGGLEALITDLDTTADGLAMGLVVDSAAGTPIDGAAVLTAAGDPAPVSYPVADFSALETDDDTSANGVFVFNSSVVLSSFTAEATGYTFGEHQAATKAGFCYFMMLASD